MAVEREHHEFVLLTRELDARDVAVSIERHLHRASHTALDVVGQHGHLRVFLTCLRILILIVAGIEPVLILRGSIAPIPREGEGLHVRLVKANPRQHLAVGREVEGAIEGKFLLIHPVGLAVDDLIHLTVLRDLTLGIVIEQFHQENIIVPHEGNLVAVRRKLRTLLRPTLREWLQRLVLHIIYIIYRSGGTTVDVCAVRLNQNVLLVR